MINSETLNTVLEALRFYAKGNHERSLTGFRDGKPIVWEDERNRLEALGYHFHCESYNGMENYVKNGTLAQKALDLLEKEMG